MQDPGTEGIPQGMTEAVSVLSVEAGSDAAGRALGEQIATRFLGAPPDAVVVFASAHYDYSRLLEALERACRPRVLVGCSSAGEFIGEQLREGAVSAMALRSPDLQFTATLGRGLRADRSAAAQTLVSGFAGRQASDFRYRYALILADALAGYTDDLVEHLTRLTAGTYRFFGGGAGDDTQFSRTHVFFGTEAFTDAAVALEILSNKPFGIGVRHGWQPASGPFRVTDAEGAHVRSLNAIPATDVVAEHASATGQTFDPAQPLPFFLQNVLGIDTGGGHKLRVPLGARADGSIDLASDVPTGATVNIMAATAASAAEAAAAATHDAAAQLGGLQPKAALFFDCVATRLRNGEQFGDELASVQAELGPTATFAGCNTYGQIARVEGQFSGFHNCTAVVCVIPD